MSTTDAPPPENICQLDKPYFYQCCCVCRCHLRIFTNDMMPTEKWICTLPLSLGEAFVIECEKHSCGCECWDDTRTKGDL
jgi:hypothetical protein